MCICGLPSCMAVTLNWTDHFSWLNKALWSECAIAFQLTPIFEVKHTWDNQVDFLSISFYFIFILLLVLFLHCFQPGTSSHLGSNTKLLTAVVEFYLKCQSVPVHFNRIVDTVSPCPAQCKELDWLVQIPSGHSSRVLYITKYTHLSNVASLHSFQLQWLLTFTECLQPIHRVNKCAC